jgi:folate-binding protein YgfZ
MNGQSHIPLAYVSLADRGVILVSGGDRQAFLQGLVSNDVARVSPGTAIHAALLTPQGKYLHDFFIAETGDAILLDCEGGRIDDLLRRLRIYVLRADVKLEDATGDLAVAALFGNGSAKTAGLTATAGAAVAFQDGIAFVDPRLAAAGIRAILPRNGIESGLENAGFTAATAEDYDTLRLGLGLPDASRDMEIEKAILLENGFEELNGVDFHKGCFLGQELTARTKHRGLIKKRLMPVTIEGPCPEADTPIMLDGAEAGRMRSGLGRIGLALMRLEYLDKAAGRPFTAGAARIIPRKPGWAAV